MRAARARVSGRGPLTRRRIRFASLIAVLAALCAVVGATAPIASATESITTATGQPVYLVNPGDTAHVGIKLNFTGTPVTGTGLDRDVTFTYTLGTTLSVGSGSTLKTLPSTAVNGVDYSAPVTGTVTFPAGTATGTVLTFDIPTLANSTPSVAKTINTTIACTTGCTGVTVTGYNNDPSTIVINGHGFDYQNPALPVATRVADLMSHMSLADKVGQMDETLLSAANNGTTTNASSWNNSRAWELGSILSGGSDNPTPNTATGWSDLIDNFEYRAMATPLQIPLIYGSDAVHGNQHLPGATIFPHNIGMGATRDPSLALQEGQITAQELRSTGPQFAFSPCICVARDIRWGRTYESVGEDPALSILMESNIDGMQGTNPLDKTGLHVVTSAKHFAGDGLTSYGTGSGNYTIDQGVDQVTRAQFAQLALAPYIPAVQVHHTGAIMPSYSSVQYTDSPAEATPTKMHARGDLMTGWLKNQIGFDGFLISDYDGINQIPDTHTADGLADAYTDQIWKSFGGGMDMVMAPSQPEFKNFQTDLISLVNSGKIPQSRIDDAVQRILTQKFELGVFEHPFTDRSTQSQIGSAAHRAVARQAVVESQVLLKNAGNMLPLSKTPAKVYVAGSNADNGGNQTGGWTITWQGTSGNGTAEAPFTTTIRQAIQNVVGTSAVTFSTTASPAPAANTYDYGVVVVGEHAYAEGQGDVGTPSGTTNGSILSLNTTTADTTAITNVCSAMPCVVLVVSGRPLTLTDAQFAQANAVVESWLPGTEGEGVADVLFGDKPFTGRLSQSWPRTLTQEPLNVGDASYDPRFPFGWGLRIGTGFSTKSSLQQARDALIPISGDSHVTAAVADLDALLGTAATWNPNGSVSDPGAFFRALQPAANELAQSPAPTFTQDDGVVSAARDVAQAAVVKAGGPNATTSPLIANADDALLNMHPDTAVQLLSQAAGDLTPPTTAATVDPPSPDGLNGWYVTNPLITLTATDDTGVASTEYYIGQGGAWTPYLGPFNMCSVAIPCGMHWIHWRSTDTLGNVEATKSLTLKADLQNPTSTATIAPAPHNGWYPSPTVTLTGDDGPTGSGIDHISYSLDGGPYSTYMGPLSGFATGNHFIQFRATDVAGRVESTTNMVAFKADAVLPSVTITKPADGAVYPLDKVLTAAYKCTDKESGLASCVGTVPDGSPINTATVGVHTFTVTATDLAGNVRTTTVTYTVVFTWNGFFSPIGNESDSSLNLVHAGDLIKVGFGLNGDRGLNIGTFTSTQVTCPAWAPHSVPAAGSGATAGLAYGASSGHYTYGWQTSAAWAGQCRQFSLALTDGTAPHTAVFMFFS